MCGACGTVAHQPYTACLRGQLSSNVRHHEEVQCAPPPAAGYAAQTRAPDTLPLTSSASSSVRLALAPTSVGAARLRSGRYTAAQVRPQLAPRSQPAQACAGDFEFLACGLSPYTRARCLTLRSSRPRTAGRLGGALPWSMLHRAAQASHRAGRLSSNVRHQLPNPVALHHRSRRHGPRRHALRTRIAASLACTAAQGLASLRWASACAGKRATPRHHESPRLLGAGPFRFRTSR